MDKYPKLTGLSTAFLRAIYTAAMRKGAAELELVQHHVCRGAVLVERQRAIVARFLERGWPAGHAEKLFELFITIQRQHEAHLAACSA